MLLAAALVFASLLLAVFAAVATVAGVWFWWRTKDLRKRAAESRGVTIEGEYREYREEREVSRRLDDRR